MPTISSHPMEKPTLYLEILKVIKKEERKKGNFKGNKKKFTKNEKKSIRGDALFI